VEPQGEIVMTSINFQVDLSIASNETVGPVTNSRNVGMLHPDMHQSSPDNGVVEKARRVTNQTAVTWIPGLLGASNRELKHGDTFTEYGLKAIYLRDMYGIGYAPADRAVLKIV
jgi:hypothetical protein